MKIKVKCPASCGELIQGIIGDSEKLISLPINIYSEIILEESNKGYLYKDKGKAVMALYKTLEYFKIPMSYADHLKLTINSSIPIAKGMASSTADICGTIMATAKIIGKKITLDELAKLCCSIEPTDSTIFDKLTLFDHIEGKLVHEFDWKPQINILILEGKDTLNTQEFRKNDYSSIRNSNKKTVKKAFELFSKACTKKDKKSLGKACTISSLANQGIISKPRLNEIIEKSLKMGAYGVNVAHSGTVLGILYDEDIVDIAKLKYLLMESNIENEYFKVYKTLMVEGGVSFL